MPWTWSRLHAVVSSLHLPPREHVAGIGARLLVNRAVDEVDFAELLVTPAVHASLLQHGWQPVPGEDAIEHPSEARLIARTGDVDDVYTEPVANLLATARLHDGVPVVPIEAARPAVTRALIMGGVLEAMQAEDAAQDSGSERPGTDAAAPRGPYDPPTSSHTAPSSGGEDAETFDPAMVEQLDVDEFGRRLQEASRAAWGAEGPPPLRILGLPFGVIMWIPIVFVSAVVASIMIVQFGGFAHLLGHTDEVAVEIIDAEDAGACDDANEVRYDVRWTTGDNTHEDEYEDCISRSSEPQPTGSTLDLWVNDGEVVADHSPLVTRVGGGAVFLAPIVFMFAITGRRKMWWAKRKQRRKERTPQS